MKQLASDLPYLSGGKATAQELEKKLVNLIESKYAKIFDKGRGGQVEAAEEVEEEKPKKKESAKKVKEEDTEE